MKKLYYFLGSVSPDEWNWKSFIKYMEKEQKKNARFIAYEEFDSGKIYGLLKRLEELEAK